MSNVGNGGKSMLEFRPLVTSVEHADVMNAPCMQVMGSEQMRESCWGAS